MAYQLSLAEQQILSDVQQSQAPLAVIAGNGQLPGALLEEAKRRGIEVLLLAIRFEAHPQWLRMATYSYTVSPGRLGHILRLCRKHQVKNLMMLGGVRKVRLFSLFAIDWTGLQLLCQVPWRSDDVLLRAVTAFFAQQGITLLSPRLLLPHLMTPTGLMTQRAPTSQQWYDIQQGIHLAWQIGQLDIGQTLIVHKGVVVAVEALEGTNACIERAGSMIPQGGGVMIKVAKPQQDLRLDLPTVGVETLEYLARARIPVLAIEAHKTMIVDPNRFYQTANALRLIVVGFHGTQTMHDDLSWTKHTRSQEALPTSFSEIKPS